MNAALINKLASTFPHTALLRELARFTDCTQYSADEQKAINTMPKATAMVLTQYIRNIKHCTLIVSDLFEGQGVASQVQPIVQLAYPTCTHKTASQYLSTWRNTDKYLGRAWDSFVGDEVGTKVPHYRVAGGRSGTVRGVAVGELPKDMKSALKGLFGL